MMNMVMDGKPVFLFHGSPGSRAMRHPDESVASSMGARVITIDRPGYGNSHYSKDRTLLSWTNDISQLADYLKMQEFSIIGVSGGGPHAAACAVSLPSRVDKLSLVSCPAPYDTVGMSYEMSRQHKVFYSLTKKSPWLLRSLLWFSVKTAPTNPDKIREKLKKELTAEELSLFDNPDFMDIVMQDTKIAFQTGVHGCVKDFQLIFGSWGFKLEDIKTQSFLWYGDADQSVPVSMSEYISKTVTNIVTTKCRGEGHLLFFSRWSEILNQVL